MQYPSGEKAPSDGRIFMEHSGPIKSEIHYHIFWTFLDWKPFATKDEANKCAAQIKRPNESYTIVERDDECERCKQFKSKACSAFSQ
jgi:hypothetical protein